MGGSEHMTIHGYSPLAAPRSADWPPTVHVAGYWLVPASQQLQSFPPSAELEAFLGAGPPPVYMGWGSMVAGSSEAMAVTSVVLLGVAQDGGTPHAGCACGNCAAARTSADRRRHPVALGVALDDGRRLLVEATKAMADQLWMWADALGERAPVVPDMLAVTHLHTGHVEGLGQFGTEVMGKSNVPLMASESVLAVLQKRDALAAFLPSELDAVPGVTFLRVPHRNEHGGDTHAVLLEGASGRKLLFLPDHDSWDGTLDGATTTVREWLTGLDVDVALLDGTFYSSDELDGRDMKEVPHPCITETLGRLGQRRSSDFDVDVAFVHLNHTNPCNDAASAQAHQVTAMGWRVAREGEVHYL